MVVLLARIVVLVMAVWLVEKMVVEKETSLESLLVTKVVSNMVAKKVGLMAD